MDNPRAYADSKKFIWCCCCSWQNIRAIGGYNGSYLAVNEMYDSSTDTWTTKTAMPTARRNFGIAVVQDKIYVIGGMVGPRNESSGYTGVTEVYDPETDTWETRTSMPTPRNCLFANVVNNKIYLIGGLKYYEISFVDYVDENINEVYDPETDTWTTKASMPECAWSYASAVLENKIYMIGGLRLARMWADGATIIHDNNHIYDAETDTWSSGKAAPTIVFNGAGGATTGTLAPKRIYVLGGMNATSTIPTEYILSYFPENDTWITGSPLISPRIELGVAVVNDELYAIGGKTVDTYLSVNEMYTPVGYIPEFSSWVVFPLFLTVSLVVIVYRKRLHKTGSNHICSLIADDC